ncbi:Cytochrome P450 4V2 [Sarcoptes scabiei]|uniref:Cytochrome P450 4V2 n=1 Tax=Sarcoptes scabiei TaxID=52283 RepID=A0A834VGZ8_SARSC|nr:Cytochrome P450 4V2 [Sarcoptes scabiei]
MFLFNLQTVSWALLGLAIFFAIKFIIGLFKLINELHRFDGMTIDKKKFFMGNLHQFSLYELMNINDYYFQWLQGCSKIFDKSFLIWLTYKPMLIIHTADSAETVLNSNVVIEKSDEYRMMRPWLKGGLLLSGGNRWRQRRKLLTPTFHFNILEQFLEIMNDNANILIKVIRQKISDNITAEREGLNIVPLFTNVALDIIAETAMGVQISSQKNLNQQYVETITRLSSSIIQRISLPWLQNDFIYFNLFARGRACSKDLKLVHDFTMNVIKERKKMLADESDSKAEVSFEAFESKRKRRLAFMDLLIDQHNNDPIHFTLEDIQEEVDTFMFEGHDTTAMSMIWTLFLLAHHQNYQMQARKEVQMICEEIPRTKGWSSEHLRRMKFLEACIKESLRLYPSVPIISRKASENTVIDSKKVPKNLSIILLLHSIQRDPKYFDHPERFIPERFLENSMLSNKRINPFAFVPFSAGPRNCIGQKFALQEEKIILATVLLNFQVHSRYPIDQVYLQPELILRPKSTVDLIFETI